MGSYESGVSDFVAPGSAWACSAGGNLKDSARQEGTRKDPAQQA